MSECYNDNRFLGDFFLNVRANGLSNIMFRMDVSINSQYARVCI